MFIVRCFMEASFCTLLTKKVQMENFGMSCSTSAFTLGLKSISKIDKTLKINCWLNWTVLCSVLYEVFPMSFLMEQAGGQSFTGKERVIYISFNWHWQFFSYFSFHLKLESPIHAGIVSKASFVNQIDKSSLLSGTWFSSNEVAWAISHIPW